MIITGNKKMNVHNGCALPESIAQKPVYFVHSKADDAERKKN
jgi:hypothetical protein